MVSLEEENDFKKYIIPIQNQIESKINVEGIKMKGVFIL